jgi:hypothetical protein
MLPDMLQPFFILTVLCEDKQCLMFLKYSARWDPLILVKGNAVNIIFLLIIFQEADGTVLIQFEDASHS